jgi:hypothetical protein
MQLTSLHHSRIQLTWKAKEMALRLFRSALSGFTCCLLIGCVSTNFGCRAFRDNYQPTCEADCRIMNPMIVPMMDRWYLMDQISDELDNYFQIYREERIRVIDGILTEGWIETHPRIGGTILEPWKKDSTAGFEVAHSTLQTVRRFAKVRVIPFGNSYQIDLKVYKELEDLPQPVGSPIGGQILRFDNTLGSDVNEPVARQITRGWIPMGRDFALEQKILANLQSRFRKAVE